MLPELLLSVAGLVKNLHQTQLENSCFATRATETCCHPSPPPITPNRSKSAEVAAQCGVVDEKVLQALQRIDDAVEAEVGGLPEGLVDGLCLLAIC